jgi:hypothetical protein
MVGTIDNHLIIQGSSLKGCIRSIYEAITNSSLGVVPSNEVKKEQGKYPPSHLPCRNRNELCPASLLFGASGDNWGWRGLIDFKDAKCTDVSSAIGFMPSLWEPKNRCKAYFRNNQAIGRKFYYHMERVLDKGDAKSGISVQQANDTYLFKTRLNFKNLKSEALGALLISLGQDPQYPIALKMGAGKPIGMGTLIAKVIAADVFEEFNEIQNFYRSYDVNPRRLEEEELQKFINRHIKQAHNLRFIKQNQLQEIYNILGYQDSEPPTRQPYEKYSWIPPRR